MIELTTLRYFTTAFETGTFSQAARVNDVSQPTVSAAIQKLENKLGTALFRRSKSGLKPTPLAIRLYHDVVDSVAHLATLETRLAQQPRQILRVHCAPDMLMQGITAGLNRLCRDTPDLSLSFTNDPDQSDLAYLSDQCLPDSHRFIPLTQEPFCIALPRFHPLAAQPDGLTLRDIQNQPLIHRPYCPNADQMELAPLRATAAAQATNDQQLLDLIAAGLGIAFVPRSHGDHRDDIVVLPLRDAMAGTRVIGISHRKSAYATGLAERLAANHRGPKPRPHQPDGRG